MKRRDVKTWQKVTKYNAKYTNNSQGNTIRQCQ